MLQQIYYGRYSMADILQQIYYSRCIMAAILRRIHDGLSSFNSLDLNTCLTQEPENRTTYIIPYNQGFRMDPTLTVWHPIFYTHIYTIFVNEVPAALRSPDDPDLARCSGPIKIAQT